MFDIINRVKVRKALIPVTAAAALVLGIAMSGPVSVTAAATPTWQTTFRDDFTGSGLPNPANWLLTLGTSYPGGPDGFGTGEIETMTNNPSNVDVRNGNLYITPQRDVSGQWTSARVETNSVFKPADGGIMRMESRLQMPNVTGAEAAGYWPAFWALGGPYRNDRWSWPRIGEFDIMENVNGLNWTYNVLHCGVWAGGPCNEQEGINNGKPGNNGEPCLGTTCQAGFHTYAIEWDRSGDSDQLRWYLDGVLTFTVNQNQVPAQTWADLSGHDGYFIILNVAMGGAFPNKLGGGPTSATKPGVPMIVDYVEVKYAGGSGVPTTTTTPATTSPTTTVPATTPGTTTSTPASSPATTGGTPTNLRKTGQTASTITLSWDGASTATYDILRGEKGDKIASVTGNSFTDQGLLAGTAYVYSVRSSGGTTSQVTMTIGNAATTPTSTPATTSGTTPATDTPTNLRKTGQTASTITLSWDGASTATYDILRGEDRVKIASVTGNSFTDGGLLGGTAYVYSVRSGSVTTPRLTTTIS